MSGRAPRRLLATRRRVPAARHAEYDAAWNALRGAAELRGAHAWRFLNLPDDALFLEFVEFAADADPRADAGFIALLSRLDAAFGPGEAGEWTELN